MINDGLVIITLIIKIIKTPVMINNIELNLHEWICWIRGGLEGRGKGRNLLFLILLFLLIDNSLKCINNK